MGAARLPAENPGRLPEVARDQGCSHSGRSASWLICLNNYGENQRKKQVSGPGQPEEDPRPSERKSLVPFGSIPAAEPRPARRLPEGREQVMERACFSWCLSSISR